MIYLSHLLNFSLHFHCVLISSKFSETPSDQKNIRLAIYIGPAEELNTEFSVERYSPLFLDSL